MKVVALLLALIPIIVLADIPNSKILSTVNDLRSEYAKKYEIANMNELAYDDYMEGLAQSYLDEKCPEDSIVTLNNVFIFIDPTKDDLDNYIVSEPGVSKFAFIKHQCASRSVIVMDIASVPMINEAPGSRCLEDRQSNNNGLCGVKKGYARKGWAEDLQAFFRKIERKGK